MQVITTIAALRERLSIERSVALVPTMGNLHAGHLHLVRLAGQQEKCVVASIFVNPLQFGANEDLASYPRTLAADCAQLEQAGTDVVFAPAAAEMYPVPQTVTVALPALANQLCGAFRPGHFNGVATVVLKLLHIVAPQCAVFGRKDFQQLCIIRTLVQQLNLPVNIIAADIVREADGLAMSSRNSYLSAVQRQQAPQLNQALQQAVTAASKPNANFRAIEVQIAQNLAQRGWVVDYVAIRSSTDLGSAGAADRKLIALAAARLGKTRLIDNIEFNLD